MAYPQRDFYPPSPRVVAVISRRHRLPPPTAALIAELAGIGTSEPSISFAAGGKIQAHHPAGAAQERRP